VAALATAASAFLVALPVESTHLAAKQIAFGQLVNVYVRTAIDGAEEGLAVNTIHVVCCTTLGAVASVLAMLLPCPHLAYYKVITNFILLSLIHFSLYFSL